MPPGYCHFTRCGIAFGERDDAMPGMRRGEPEPGTSPARAPGAVPQRRFKTPSRIAGKPLPRGVSATRRIGWVSALTSVVCLSSVAGPNWQRNGDYKRHPWMSGDPRGFHGHYPPARL